MFDKLIKTIEIENLDAFLDEQIPKELDIEYKKHRFNPVYQLAKFQSKRLENMMKDKIKVEIEKNSYTFEDWENNPKIIAKLEKKDGKVILGIFEKRF
jgi:hypothetical protein